jgi:hypothetical protein
MLHVPQPLRMPVELVCSESQRAQRAAHHRMSFHPSNADRPTRRHANA